MQIELQNISKSYTNDTAQRDVLSNISLDINTGETIAIIGPSGSGKSTLLNIIGTLDKPSSGSILFNNNSITSFSEAALADLRNRKLGFVFQTHQLLPHLNILENVLVPTIPIKSKTEKKLLELRAKEILEELGLNDKLQQYPGQMSVGECQRTAVARALINNPEMLLADEPTGSLDNHTAGQMSDLLLKIQKEHAFAMVVVTHSPVLAGKMAAVYELINGELKKV